MKQFDWKNCKREIEIFRKNCNSFYVNGVYAAIGKILEIIENNIKGKKTARVELEEFYEKTRDKWVFHSQEISLKDYDKLYNLAIQAIEKGEKK
jgi:hypothetical protein